MAAVSETIVREYFEMQEFLVRQHRKYIAQTKARPPTFVLIASRADQLPDSYRRYLVNSLRESFDLPGVPIRLTVKAGKNPYAEGEAKSGPAPAAPPWMRNRAGGPGGPPGRPGVRPKGPGRRPSTRRS